jgi:hypothetical protein
MANVGRCGMVVRPRKWGGGEWTKSDRNPHRGLNASLRAHLSTEAPAGATLIPTIALWWAGKSRTHPMNSIWDRVREWWKGKLPPPPVQAFTTDRPDETLNIWVLPG